MIYAPMYGRISEIYRGIEDAWLVELDNDGTPRVDPCTMMIPEAELPDVLPVWCVHLPTRFHGTPYEMALLFWKMRRSMAMYRGWDLNRRYWWPWDWFYDEWR